MDRRKRLSIALAFVFASTGCRMSQTVERQTDDAAIDAKIKARSSRRTSGPPRLRPWKSTSRTAWSTLAGPVSSAEERQKIETAARSVEGVVSVTNNTQVSGTQVPPPQPATTSAPATAPPISGDKPVFVPFPTATPKP